MNNTNSDVTKNEIAIADLVIEMYTHFEGIDITDEESLNEFNTYVHRLYELCKQSDLYHEKTRDNLVRNIHGKEPEFMVQADAFMENIIRDEKDYGEFERKIEQIDNMSIFK